jgi:hypothetical protein
MPLLFGSSYIVVVPPRFLLLRLRWRMWEESGDEGAVMVLELNVVE